MRNDLPPLPRMLTSKELRQLVTYTPQHVARLEKRGQFPKRRVGWWLHEVMDWLAATGNQTHTSAPPK